MSLPEPDEETNEASNKYHIGRTKGDGGKRMGGTGILRMRQKLVHITPALFTIANTSKYYLSIK